MELKTVNYRGIYDYRISMLGCVQYGSTARVECLVSAGWLLLHTITKSAGLPPPAYGDVSCSYRVCEAG